MADARRLGELNNAVGALWPDGKFHEAIEPARRALAIIEKAFGPDDWRTADSRRQVETLEAVAALPIEGREALAGVPALAVAGDSALRDGRFKEAADIVRRCLEINRRWLGERNHRTATFYNNLAYVLRGLRDLPNADAMNRKALEIRLAVLGERHPDTANSYGNLATVLHDRGDRPGAEAMQRRALAILLAVHGERHPRTAASYNNLAHMLKDRGNLPGAEAMNRRALAIRLAVHGERHSETISSYAGLGLVLAELGRSRDSIDALENAARTSTEVRN